MAIYMWKEGGWQPGANTIAYYPFRNSIIDETGNYNWDSGTATYSNNMATVSSLRRSGSPFQGYTGDFTISAWLEVSDSNFIFKGDSSYNPSLFIAGATGGTGVNYYSSGWKGYTTTKTAGEILLVTGTKDSGTMYVYINGILTGSFLAPNYPGYGGSSGDTMSANGIFGECFIEDKARTAQEIADYYDFTKGNYGIS